MIMLMPSDLERALKWYQDHTEHVDKLVAAYKAESYSNALEDKSGYRPFGSDEWRPELWKAGHWVWFLSR